MIDIPFERSSERIKKAPACGEGHVFGRSVRRYADVDRDLPSPREVVVIVVVVIVANEAMLARYHA